MDDKRKHKRLKKKMKSEVHSKEGMTFSDSVDISKGGIFISTPEPIGSGSEINLSIQMPGGKVVDIKGIVKWVRNDDKEGERAGMGIEFTDVDPDIDEVVGVIE